MIERRDTEVLEGLPVLADESDAQLVAARPAASVQTAAVAAGGFVAGAVVVGVLGRRRRQRTVAARAARRVGRGRRSTRELVEIVGSRSLLVDVHLLGSSPRGGR